MRVVLDNITHTYQRQPSVGMPRHALRRRMPNSATGRPHLLGGRVFFLLVYDVCEALGRAPCRACYPKFTTTRSGINKRDLENYPLEFPEILHVAPNQ